MRLPDGNGNELMADLRARFGLKGIALSGYGDANALNRSAEAGFVIHLTKPVRIEALERALAAATRSL
jgi:CheY-like chemotaxis protein